MGPVMSSLHYLCLPLLLSVVFSSKYPDFYDDYDDYDSHEVCEGDACVYKYVFLWLEKTKQVPNISVTYTETDYFDVDIESLLAECAPSLSVGDIATLAKSCDDVERKYRRACNYRKNGWLGEDGVTVKDSLDKDFDAIAGVSKNILKCLRWDGVVDSIPFYYYGNYDYAYDYLEESGEKGVRQKREVQSNIPEFLIQGNHTRKKRNSKKRKQQNKQKGSKRSKGGNRKAGRKGRRTTKREKNHKDKHGQRSSEKKRTTSRKNQKRRKKIDRKKSNIKRKKEKKANN